MANTLLLGCPQDVEDRAPKEGVVMNYLDFNPELTQERRQQMLREVDSLRLQMRLRDNHKSSGSRFFALARRSALPLLRAAGLTR
jgi:hypothetical protein